MVTIGLPIRLIGWASTAVALTALLGVACVSLDNAVPVQEVRAQEIEKGIMCPVCPGESIDQSQHPLALQMRAAVEEKVGEGWSGNRIRTFFVERYGPSVLLEPPRTGFSVLVWIVPPAGLAFALVVLYLVLRTMARSRAVEPERDRQWMSDDERARYFERVEAALAYEDVPVSESPPSGRSDSEEGRAE